MLDFYFKKRHMKEEKEIASKENNNRYLNERYCYISESRWDVQYLENCASRCLV